jgi:hypothetical protein
VWEGLDRLIAMFEDRNNGGSGGAKRDNGDISTNKESKPATENEKA